MTYLSRFRPFLRSLFGAVLLFAMASPVLADKVILKSGSTVEGTVLDALETPTEYVVEIKTGTIKEKKKFLKSEVERIEKPKPDDIEVEKLKPILPTPVMLPLTEYRKRFDLVDKFLKTYPDSAHKADVEKIAAELKDEMTKVEAGGIKTTTGWLTAEEAKAHKENVEAERKLLLMQQRAYQGNYVAALRDFVDLETNYYGTVAYPKAVEAAQKVVSAYGNSLVNKHAETKAMQAIEAERQSRLSDIQKNQIAAAKAEEAARFEQFAAQEKKSGTKWLTVNPNDLQSMEAGIAALQKEATRLQGIDVASMKQQAELYYQVETQLAEKKVIDAKATMASAAKVKTGRSASRVGYVASLNERIKETELLVKEEAKAKELAEEEALAKAKAEADAAKMAARGDGSTEGASALDALNQLAQAKKATPAEEEKTTTKKAPTKPKRKAASEESTDEEDPTAKPKPVVADSGEGFSFNPMMLVYILAPVMIGVTVFLYLKDKKAKQG